MELVHCSSDPNLSGLSLRYSEHHNQCPHQTPLAGLQMGARHPSSPQHIPKMRTSRGGSLHHLQEQAVYCFLLKRGSGPPVLGRCLSSILEELSGLCVSANVADIKGDKQYQAGQRQKYSNSADLAKTSLVPLPASPVCPTVVQAHNHASSPVTGCRSCASSQAIGSPPQGMAHGVRILLLYWSVTGITEQSKEVNLHLQKWNTWCCCLLPDLLPLLVILDYLLNLKKLGLSTSAVKVLLAAISAFHLLVERFSIFAHLVSGRFIKSLGTLWSATKLRQHLRHYYRLWQYLKNVGPLHGL